MQKVVGGQNERIYEGIEDDAFGNAHDWLRLKVFHVFAGVQLATLIMPRSASTDNGFASLPRWTDLLLVD
ncbi:hypothetical protein J8983_00050 [Klebsiella pneumoniae]|uniref:hypothetical protein n=1 Tax=Klebsiella pneumoniae TaxID=573 RepID=UPI002F96ACBF